MSALLWCHGCEVAAAAEGCWSCGAATRAERPGWLEGRQASLNDVRSRAQPSAALLGELVDARSPASGRQRRASA